MAATIEKARHTPDVNMTPSKEGEPSTNSKRTPISIPNPDDIKTNFKPVGCNTNLSINEINNNDKIVAIHEYINDIPNAIHSPMIEGSITQKKTKGINGGIMYDKNLLIFYFCLTHKMRDGQPHTYSSN